ncbi:tyrosine decarboxylase MfnA [Methanofollis aquaemaris]|uniref:Probable L-tyrosine/L-aspartate decarboxylase n=1 Tax=Methanofollis aquaemaris TaxID=126734 RepID=A0A8A3S6E1_9EURY|nr:tyrosine decarboxylase MfnA [Methanofollis aquaemaris]QSZ67705.1 tyrosine decarboxylase MfnA [Methanofollis aquaemaris]
MQANGISEEELFSFLSLKKGEDSNYHHVLSSMCTIPHPVAVRAHQMFIEANLGDPGLFAGTASIEELLIERLGTLFHHPKAGGYATSGGTESNLQALRIFAKMKSSRRPNVVVPESAHFSFEKACDILSLEMRTVPSDETFRMDVDALQDRIDENTCCVVAVAGTTEYGVVDPIRVVSEITHDAGVPLHVDAAFGGLVIPFLDPEIPFDFALPGVSSIAVDPHKMGMSTIPCGSLLVREPSWFGLLNVETPYLTVKQECTLAGTRSGGAVVGAFAVLEYLGMSGMKAVVEGCMKNTRRLIEGMETHGYRRAVTPDLNVATFEAGAVPPGWRVSWTRRGHMRTVMMPHVTRDVIEEFVRDIGEMDA